MKDIMQDKYILGQSQSGIIGTVGEEIRLDLSLDPNTNNLTGGKISGKVTTTTGDPIENALIKIMSSNFDPLMHDLTDINGDYSFTNVSPNATYNIFAVASGMKTNQGNQFTVSEYENITMNFTMEEDSAMSLCVVAGDLVDQSNNNPVEGAIIFLYKVNADSTETLQAVTYTNQYGQFVYREVPLGDYVVRITSLGYNPTEANITLSEQGQLLPMNVSIIQNSNTSRGTVSGIITDNNNQPINRADVILYKVETDTSLTPMAFTKTNIAGIYLFANVEPGEYKVKSNEIEIVSIDVPEPLVYAPNFSEFTLFYTENYIINEYIASEGTLGDGASVNPTTGFVQGLNIGFVTINITVPRTGDYYLAVRYLASVDKILSVSTNNQDPINVLCYQTPSTNVQDAKIRYIHASLNEGQNTIKFYNKFQLAPPDIDTINVYILPYNSTENIASGVLENGASVNQNNFILGLGGAQNGSVTFTVNIPVDGTYTLGVNYVNTTGGTRPMKISIDGGIPIIGTFVVTPTGLAEDAIKAVISLGTLTSGNHSIKFYNDTGEESILPGPSQIRISVPIETTLAKDGLLENGALILQSGYIELIGGSNQGSVTITAVASESGKYSLGVQYVNGTNIIGNMKISINGGTGVEYIFPKTTSNLEEDAEIYYTNIDLIEGNNTIKFYNDDPSVTTQSPVINKIFTQKILIYESYNPFNSNVTLSNGAQIQNGLITNVGTGLGEILLTYPNLPFYGPYFLEMMYLTTTSDKKCNIDVNTVSTNETYTFDPTSSLNIADAKVKKIPVFFNVGTNTIKVYTASTNS